MKYLLTEYAFITNKIIKKMNERYKFCFFISVNIKTKNKKAAYSR